MHEEKHEALKEAVLGGAGDTSRAIREQIFAFVEALTCKKSTPQDKSLSSAHIDFLSKLARRAVDIDSNDLDALRSHGCSDDSLFEIAVVGSVAAGLARYTMAMRVLEEST